MKTGKAADVLGVDRGTINNWIAAVPAFFSDAAQGKDRAQREVNQDDLLVLNTIKTLRNSGMQDWNEISRFLESGKRYTELPQTALTVDTGETPLDAVQNALALKAQLDNALVREAELQQRLKESEQGRAADRQRIESLLVEKGELTGEIKVLREMLKRE